MKWKTKAEAVKTETGTALQLLYNALNQGQQNKVLKDPSIKELLERYNIIVIEE